ncbi:hypothetical protein ACM66B_002466 [Microbotryomycetes sp. NB124-2]
MVSGLHCLSYVAGTAAFVFVLLSLASGLLYVAEVIEEHSSTAKAVGQRIVYGIILVLVALHFADGLPLYLTALGIVSHFVYLQNFSRTWPSISLLSPTFILSCVLVLTSHFVSFRYFSDRARANGGYNSYNRGGRWNQHASHYAYGHEDTFMDVATYFGICVWLTPFFLFLSLSANDNVLPSAGEMQAATNGATATQSPTMSKNGGVGARPSGSPIHSRKHSSMMKTALSSVFAVVPRSLRPTVLTRGAGSQRDGLIATPLKSGSQPPTPSEGPKSWPAGSPSPSLAYGFPRMDGGLPSPTSQTSPILMRKNSGTPTSAGGAGGANGTVPTYRQVVGHQSAQGLGLRSPAAPVRRHTTEEGVGLGVAAGMTINTASVPHMNGSGGGEFRSLPSPLSRIASSSGGPAYASTSAPSPIATSAPNNATHHAPQPSPTSPPRRTSRPSSPTRQAFQPTAINNNSNAYGPGSPSRASFSGPSSGGQYEGVGTRTPRRTPSSSSLLMPGQPSSPRRSVSECYPTGVPPVPLKQPSFAPPAAAVAAAGQNGVNGSPGAGNGTTSVLGQRVTSLSGPQTSSNIVKRKAA